MRKLAFVLVSITLIGGCDSSDLVGEASADVNGDGYISPDEASAEFAKAAAIEFQPGNWDIEHRRGDREYPLDQECVSQDDLPEFIDRSVYFEDHGFLRSLPNEACEIHSLSASNSHFAMNFTCERRGESLSYQMESEFTPTSFSSTFTRDELIDHNSGVECVEGEECPPPDIEVVQVVEVTSGQRTGGC